MNNAQNNKGFLQSSSATLRNSILDNIANHYGVTRDVIYQELTTGTPEDVMEYVTVDRPAVHFMYKAYMGAFVNAACIQTNGPASCGAFYFRA